MGRPLCIALVSDETDISVQVQWAFHLARLRQMDVQFFLPIQSDQSRLTTLDLDAPAETKEQPLIADFKQVFKAVSDVSPIDDQANETSEASAEETSEKSEDSAGAGTVVDTNIRVSAKVIYYQTPKFIRSTILVEVKETRAALFTMVRSQILASQPKSVIIERARMYEFLPCEQIICQGSAEGMDLSRVAVLARQGRNQSAALQLSSDLADAGGSLTAFQVNPDIGVDAQLVGERQLDRFLARRPKHKELSIKRRILVSDNMQEAVKTAWESSCCDLLVVPGIALKPEQGQGFKLGRRIPVAIVVAASPLTSWTREVVKETLRSGVPQISRQDRVGLVERVQSNAEWNFDFVALMILSAGIAAFGLIQNSAAVVIGAMLVAPLMTPIIGLGLSLVQGNLKLTKISARALTRGIGVALLVGVFIGLLNPSFVEPTREIFARTQPGLLDVGVAFLSGLAAAYAQTRPNLVAALPGVAIAAALVPPIVTSGLLVSLWELELALGAFGLFLINMVVIILASMLALFAVGIRRSNQRSWSARITLAIIAAFSGLFIWTSANTYDVDITHEIPTGIEEAVESALGPDYKLLDVAIAYDELGYQLNLDVVGTEPLKPEVAKDIRRIAASFYDEAGRVRLVARISAEHF